MYDCFLLKHVWKDQNKQHEGAILIKSIKLDFVPFEGLILDGGDIYASIGKIELVTYSLGKNIFSNNSVFKLEVSDVVPWYSSLHNRLLNYEELIGIYKDDGWMNYEEISSVLESKNHASN